MKIVRKDKRILDLGFYYKQNVMELIGYKRKY